MQSIPKLLAGFVVLLSVFVLVNYTMAQPYSPNADEMTGTTIGGPIGVDTIWTAANSPYIATSSVLVQQGVALTIEPGVTIKFDAEKAMVVSGTLIARGTAVAPILFTANSADPQPGYWGYIRFDTYSTDAVFNGPSYAGGSVIQYATIEYAGFSNNSTMIPAIRVDASSPYIDHNTIRHNRFHGLRADNTADFRFTNNAVAYNGGNGILVYNEYEGGGGNVTIADNHIYGNVGTDGGYYHESKLGGGGIYVFENSSDGGFISGNIVEYNTTEWTGGGIFVIGPINAELLPVSVTDNIVAHNIARTAGGIYSESLVTIDNNQVYGNMAYEQAVRNGQVFRSGGGGIFAERTGTCLSGICTSFPTGIRGNLIADNLVLEGDGGGIYLEGAIRHTYQINNNIISGNYAADFGGGAIYTSGTEDPIYQEFRGNTIAFNRAVLGFAGALTKLSADGGVLFVENTVLSNDVEGTTTPFADTTLCFDCLDSGDPAGHFWANSTVVEGNNLLDNETPITLAYGKVSTAPPLDATMNWWGTTDTATIDNLIYDFFDQSDYGVVNYAPTLTTLNIDAPVSPPLNLQVTTGGSTFTLSWDPNPESDIAGYKVYYDENAGYPYEGTGANEGASSIDVGKVTSFALTGLPADRPHFFAVTAYDLNSNESAHSLPVRGALGPTPLRSGDFELGSSGDWLTDPGAAIVMSSGLPKNLPPISGEFAAVLGWGDRRETEMSQTFRVPQSGGILRYNYALWARRYPQHCDLGAVEVRINDAVVDDFTPFNIAPDNSEWVQCADTTDQGWLLREHNLNAYAGQDIKLSFYINPIDGSFLVLDDITIDTPDSIGDFQPDFIIENTTGAPGSSFAVKGMNFPANGRITLTLNGQDLPFEHLAADETTSFATGIVPLLIDTYDYDTEQELPAGTYVLEVAVDSLGGKVKKSFTLTIDNAADLLEADDADDWYYVVLRSGDAVTPSVTSNFANGAPGSTFALSGQNFRPDSDVSVSINDQFIQNVETDSSGSVTFALFAPEILGLGIYQIKIEDDYLRAHNTTVGEATVTIQISSTAPLRTYAGDAPVIEIPIDAETLDNQLFLPLAIHK